MLTWSTIFRAVYVVMAPVWIIAVVTSVTSFLFHLVHPEDKLREKITAAARNLSFDARFQSNERILTLFNGHFYLATRTIAKGDTIKSTDVVREFYKFTGPAGTGMCLSKQNVVLSKAAVSIPKGHLVIAADLVPGNETQKVGVDLDRDVKTAGPAPEMSLPMVIFASASFVFGLLACAYGHVAIAILAFKKSFLWGLANIFIPFASTVFKLQNWSKSKRYFHALLIGYTGVSVGAALFVFYLETPLGW